MCEGCKLANFWVKRNHTLGLLQMRKNAFNWAVYAESEFSMNCIYEEGELEDLVIFSKPGAKGRLMISSNLLELHILLGVLLTPFKVSIENEIVKNLDLILIG